jgi:hypothetical protein
MSLDSLIVELKTLHKKLQTDGDRIQRKVGYQQIQRHHQMALSAPSELTFPIDHAQPGLFEFY